MIESEALDVLVIFFVDIKGSGAILQQMTVTDNELAYHEQIQSPYDDRFTQIITRDAAGEIIKKVGDGTLAVFRSPSMAVERALELQQSLITDRHIEVRVGIDMGEVLVQTGDDRKKDIFGRHVVWAKRAEEMAKPGHILVTKSVYLDAFGWVSKTNVRWKKQGSCIGKAGEEPIEVFEPYNANRIDPMQFPADDPGSPSSIQQASTRNENPWFSHVINNTTAAKARSTFGRIRGFWEVYHYGFSQMRKDLGPNDPLLSINLLEFDAISQDDERVMTCKFTDFNKFRKPIEFTGRVLILPYNIINVFIQNAGSETSASFIYLPESDADILYGVIAGVSGYYGSDLAHEPSAAKLALRRLGNPGTTAGTGDAEWEKIWKRCVIDLGAREDAADWREQLQRKVGGYIDPNSLNDPKVKLNKNLDIRSQLLEISRDINNEISPSTIPFCLRLS